MAEIIGLAASLITLAGASAQLARTLLEVANVIKSAEYEARMIAADISVFSSSLTQLSMVVDLPHSKTEKLREITVVLIAACRTLIEDLKMLIGEPVQRDTARLAFTMSLLRFRLRWMKVGPKVMFVKSLVDSFKTTIIVLVSTMNLAVVLQRDAPESISECLKTQVESHIKFAEDATECLHHHKEIRQDEASFFTLTLDSNASTEMGDASQGAGGELVVLSAQPLEHHSLTAHGQTLIDKEHLEDDEYPLQTTRECAQIIEMQQMSCALANDVLDSSSYKTTWNWNATDTSSLHKRASYTAVGGNLTTSETGAYVAESSEATSATSTRYYDLRQHSHATQESDARAFGQSYVANESSRSRADTRLSPRTPPEENPDDEDEMLMRGYNPQANILRENDNDSGKAIDKDKTETSPSMYAAVREYAASSYDEPDHASDEEHTALQEDRSVSRESIPFKPLRTNVPSTQNFTPLPRPPYQKFDPIRGQERQHTKEQGLVLEERVRRVPREDDRLDKIERLLAAQATAEEKRLVAKREKAEAAAAAKRAELEAAVEAKKRGDEDKLAKLESLILSQKDEQLKREAATDAGRAAEKAAADAEAVKIAEEKKVRAAIEDARKTSAPVTFHDPIGRKFPCPWYECSTREGMGEFIAKISAGVPVMLELLSNGEYDLLKDDSVVAPHLWESTVFPGSSVTMRARNLAPPPIDKKAPWYRRSISRGSG